MPDNDKEKVIITEESLETNSKKLEPGINATLVYINNESNKEDNK